MHWRSFGRRSALADCVAPENHPITSFWPLLRTFSFHFAVQFCTKSIINTAKQSGQFRFVNTKSRQFLVFFVFHTFNKQGLYLLLKFSCQSTSLPKFLRLMFCIYITCPSASGLLMVINLPICILRNEIPCHGVIIRSRKRLYTEIRCRKWIQKVKLVH